MRNSSKKEIKKYWKLGKILTFQVYDWKVQTKQN